MSSGNPTSYKRKRATKVMSLLLALVMATMLAACGKDGDTANAGQPAGDVTLVVGAYSVAKDALADILPAFESYWKAQTGQSVSFQESYEASGTQARAIVGGFEADVTLLAMVGDMDKLVKAKLVEPNWSDNAAAGMVTRSIVVLGTREGNPLGIRSFEDLKRDGVKVLYPNPKTSGGAQWDINAIYGAGLKQSEAEKGTPDPAYAKQYLADVHRNIESMDKSGRASMAAFEYGVGDVIVTYENELLARKAQGVNYGIVIPDSTILIENPAAVVARNADKHGVREVADAFIAYLQSEEAQRLFAEHGFRPMNETVAAEFAAQFPEPSELFDISYLGGWNQVRETLYSKRGVWYQVLAGK